MYLLEVNSRNTRTKAIGVVLVALFLTLNIFYTFVLVFLLLNLVFAGLV